MRRSGNSKGYVSHCSIFLSDYMRTKYVRIGFVMLVGNPSIRPTITHWDQNDQSGHDIHPHASYANVCNVLIYIQPLQMWRLRRENLHKSDKSNATTDYMSWEWESIFISIITISHFARDHFDVDGQVQVAAASKRLNDKEKYTFWCARIACKIAIYKRLECFCSFYPPPIYQHPWLNDAHRPNNNKQTLVRCEQSTSTDWLRV